MPAGRFRYKPEHVPLLSGTPLFLLQGRTEIEDRCPAGSLPLLPALPVNMKKCLASGATSQQDVDFSLFIPLTSSLHMKPAAESPQSHPKVSHVSWMDESFYKLEGFLPRATRRKFTVCAECKYTK